MNKLIIFMFIAVLFFNCSDDDDKKTNANEMKTDRTSEYRKDSIVNRESRTSREPRENRESRANRKPRENRK